MTLMLVDDDIEMIEMMCGLIDWAQYGYDRVITAAGGQEAIRTIGNDPVDLLISDIGMPIMDGYELSRLLKEKNPELMIAFLTCHEDFDHAKQAITVGADEYILKYSLTEKSLIEVLREIERKRKMRQHEEKLPLQKQNLKTTGKAFLTLTSNEDINKVLRYIAENLDKKITLQSAADYIYKNSSYLSRLFKQHIGMSFTDYLIRQRIEKATCLLADSSLSAEKISEQIGIDSVSYFYQFYKRETGKTPRGGRGNWNEE